MLSPDYISTGTLIIDDVVLPSGVTHMGCLGGGSTHAVMGMRIWSDSVGIMAKVGSDFPSHYQKQLESLFDMRGIQSTDLPTIRTWQLFEEDGKRTEVFRTSMDDFWKLVVYPGDIPFNYQNLKGVHLHCKGQDVKEWVRSLRSKGNPFILWEPWNMYTNPENLENLQQVLPLVDCFCPGLPEAQNMLEKEDSDEIIDALLAFGAKKVVIRMGSKGSRYSDSEGVHFHIPIVHVENIIDVTGAGNAYCGGFVVGMVETHDPKTAAAYAAVSASFTLEQFGALYSLNDKGKEITNRFNIFLKRISTL